MRKLAVILLSTAITLGTQTFYQNSVFAANTDGWKQAGSNRQYIVKGNYVTGWYNLSSKWYYFDSSGNMCTGWIPYNGKWYYLNTGGNMQTGWLSNNNKWYFMGVGGDMQTGWSLQKGKWYYLYNDGSRAQSCWISYNNKSYYIDNNGLMAVNTVTPDGYVVDADGAWTGKTDPKAAPKGVTAEAVSSSEIHIQWTKADDADYYYVYYSFNTDKNFNPITSKDKSNQKFQCNSGYSASITDVAPETKVYIKVTAVRAGVESNFSTVVSADTKNGTLDSPTGVTYSSDSYNSIKLTWDEVKGIDYYNVYYRKPTAAEYTVVKQTTNSMVLSNLDPETTIYFKVATVNKKKESGYSKIIEAVSDEYSDVKPTGLKAEALTNTSIKVSWDKTDGANSYYLYYKEGSNGSFTSIQCSGTNYIFKDLDEDTKYYFRLKAVNKDNKSSYSNTISAVSGDVDLDEPTGVKSHVLSSSNIEFEWNKVSDAEYYNVYYRINGNDDYTKVKRTTNYFILNNLESDTRVYLKVTAVKGELESDYSSTIHAESD